MKLTIEITDIADLTVLRSILALDPKPADTPTGKRPNGAAEKTQETHQTSPGATTADKTETASKPAPEPDTVNPFADEATATKPKGKAPPKLTLDDVNKAFASYIEAFGQSAAMADVVVMLQETFKVGKIKEIPKEGYAKAIELVTRTIEENTFNRERL